MWFCYLQSSSTAPTQPTPQGNKHRLRHHKVVARNEVDGFYYPGLVRKCINPRYVEVDFDGFERQVVGVRYVIPIEGARPCPSLKVSHFPKAQIQIHDPCSHTTPRTSSHWHHHHYHSNIVTFV